jgi:hypothetical protein
METCGVRMSRPWAKSVMVPIRLRVSVMMSELELSSAMTLPRPLVRVVSTLLVRSLAFA